LATGWDAAKMDEDLERAKEDEINAVTFSFDVSRLKEEVAFSGDTVVTVIKAQLYLEHVIMQTLAEAFKVPDVVDFRRMSFPAKLDLCVALGIYPRPWREIINRVNEMRNRVAHKLDVQVSEHAKRELWEMLPEITKQSLRSKYEKDTDPLWPMPLARIFHTIIVWTDIFRQGAKRQRIEMKYASMNAGRVMRIFDEEAEEAEASQEALELIYSPRGSGEEEPSQPTIHANGEPGR
jgi:hypothetical protein